MADLQTPTKARSSESLQTQPASSSKETPPASSNKVDAVESLAEIVRGVVAPFACGGSVDVGKQGVTISTMTAGAGAQGAKVTVSPPAKPSKPSNASYNWNWQQDACKTQLDKLKPLTDGMPQAAFGHGSQTKIDTAVRDALQLQANDFEVDIPQHVLNSILKKVRQGLKIETEILAERYSLNVYRENGKFLKHKDTPRGNDMLGTLVICLPSFYTGGAMKVTQGMKVHKFFDGGIAGHCYSSGSSAELPKPSQIKWCAFFADVDHEIHKVTGGLRITVAYLLRRKDCLSATGNIPRPLTQPEQFVRLTNAFKKAMQQDSFLAKGGKLGFPCFHLYTNGEVFPGDASAHSFLGNKQLASLKGRDAVIGRAAAAVGLKISLVPYLGHDYSAEEGGEYKLARFPDRKRTPRRMSNDTIERHFKTEEIVESFEDEALWVFDACTGAKKSAGETEWNADGYFGNEASDISFYVRAALYIHFLDFKSRQELLVDDAEAKPEDLGIVADANQELAPEHDGSGESASGSDEFPSGDDTDMLGPCDSEDMYSDEFDEDSDEFGGDIFGSLTPGMLQMFARTMASQGMPRASAKAKASGRAKAKAAPKPKAKAVAKGKAKAKAKSAAQPKRIGQAKATKDAKAKTGLGSAGEVSHKRQKR